MKKQINVIVFLIIAAAMGFAACEKGNNEKEPSTLNVRLTDSPADYAEVNVDIKEVNVKFEDDSTDNGWHTLNTHAGIYNLLDYQNGVDTLLASGTVNADAVKEIRLVLGTENSIKIGATIFPLTIPSGASSGLKIKLNQSLDQPMETVVIDFDALLSVKEENGNYKLRPVIKIK